MWSPPSTLLFPHPTSLWSACSACVCVCYMHFAQILSFPFRLDSNKNNVNKSYNNYNKSNNDRNCFVGNALFVVVAGAKLARRCSEAACAAAVFILQMPIDSGSSSSSPNQSDAPSRSVRQFVCPAEQKCRLAGQEQQPGKREAVVDSALHCMRGSRGVLQVGGIGNWDWAAAAGRAQLVAGSFELQKEPFFWFCLQHIQFFFVYSMNCHFVVTVVVLLPNQCWQILWQSETQKKE